MATTPEYTKRAIANYNAKKDRINVLADKGTKERIKAKYGEDTSLNQYICGLIEKDLKKPDQDNECPFA